MRLMSVGCISCTVLRFTSNCRPTDVYFLSCRFTSLWWALLVESGYGAILTHCNLQSTPGVLFGYNSRRTWAIMRVKATEHSGFLYLDKCTSPRLSSFASRSHPRELVRRVSNYDPRRNTCSSVVIRRLNHSAVAAPAEYSLRCGSPPAHPRLIPLIALLDEQSRLFLHARRPYEPHRKGLGEGGSNCDKSVSYFAAGHTGTRCYA